MNLVSDLGPTATYVYCVVKSALRDPETGDFRAPKLGRMPDGLLGTGKPRMLDAGDGYYVLVASAPLSLYDAAAIDPMLRDLEWVGGRATEHEALVEHAMKLGTVVPMKLFTLFTNDDRAVSHVQKMKRSLDRVVARIESCEEWGLRILFDPTRAKHPAADAIRSAKKTATATGTHFLHRKRAADEERRRAGARRAALIDELYKRVAKLARSAQRRADSSREPGGAVVLDAVFLVPHGSTNELKSILRAATRSLVAEGFNVSLNGPWPAYSFIDAR